MTDHASAGTEFFPLTRRQTLMWMDHRLSPNLPVHNVAHTIHLSGPLDLERFRQAYRRTVADIDQLRLRIDLATPRQCFLPDTDAAARVEEVDLRSCPETLDGWLGKRIARPFDFSRPPIDVALVRLAREENLFYLGQHHIVTDGISYLHIADQLADHYSGRTTHVRPSFRNYAKLEAAYQESPRAAKAETFWKAKLGAGVPPLRFYGRAQSRRTLAVERVPFGCGLERTQQLDRVAGDEAIRFLSPEFSQLVALSTVIFAFLYRTTGNRELVIATPIANRSHPLAATCGLVMEQLFLKVEVEDNETFSSLARKVRTDLAASLRHGQYCVSDRGLDFASINLIKHTPKEFSGLRAKVDFRESWAFEAASREIPGGSRTTVSPFT